MGQRIAALRTRWRRWLDNLWIRNGLGLLVFGAILGGLVAFDRMGGDAELGPLDSRSPEVGQLAPEFALRDPEGNARELGDYRGDVVWINFWASWCGPCRRELPDIQRLAAEFEDEGLVVLAVNQLQSVDTAESFWEELELDLPILLDSGGEVSEQYRLIGLPHNVFIDRDGVVRSNHIGFLTEGQMRESLGEVGLE
jgi:peroxiredoxin